MEEGYELPPEISVTCLKFTLNADLTESFTLMLFAGAARVDTVKFGSASIKKLED